MSRSGFTLIELLIVVVIIGILAAIAVPKFASTKQKTYQATMKSDLRNLVTAQEAYYYDNNAYYGGAIPNGAIPYSPSTNVTVSVTEASNVGWAATAQYADYAMTCAIFYGAAAPPGVAIQEGEVACD